MWSKWLAIYSERGPSCHQNVVENQGFPAVNADDNLEIRIKNGTFFAIFWYFLPPKFWRRNANWLEIFRETAPFKILKVTKNRDHVLFSVLVKHFQKTDCF